MQSWRQCPGDFGRLLPYIRWQASIAYGAALCDSGDSMGADATRKNVRPWHKERTATSVN